MAAKYFPGLFSRYQPLRGKGWLKALPPEEVQVFVDIGLKACDHGTMGGKGLVKKYGKKYMSKIGRAGAIKANQVKAQKRAADERYAPLDELPF
jgi:squalene cyclase